MNLDTISTEELKTEIERRERMMPEKIEFDVYLHGEYTASEWQEVFEDRTDYSISFDLARAIQNAFYEVKLRCDLDTKTGKVTLLETQLCR